MSRLAIFGLLLALLAGCASTDRDYWQPTPEVAQTPDLARIHFYRPSAAFMWAAEPQVIVNERRIGRLRNGETFYRDARPGRYRIYLVGAEDDALEVALSPGDRIYVKADIAWRVLGFRFVAEPASAAQAEPEIATLRQVTGLESDLRRSNRPPPDLDPRPDI